MGTKLMVSVRRRALGRLRVEAEDTREVVDIKALNAEIARIAARQSELRSQLDLLVDRLPGMTPFDLARVMLELEQLLGVPVEIVTPLDLPESFRARVLAEAVPV